MNIIATFILGVLIGWILEWILDWFYWRGRINKAVNENNELKEHIVMLEDELKKKPVVPITHKRSKDNLQDIKGIGPVFSKRLNDAGIHTFEQLSQLTPKNMEEILGTLFKRFFADDNTILAQAKEFAEQKTQNG